MNMKIGSAITAYLQTSYSDAALASLLDAAKKDEVNPMNCLTCLLGRSDGGYHGTYVSGNWTVAHYAERELFRFWFWEDRKPWPWSRKLSVGQRLVPIIVAENGSSRSRSCGRRKTADGGIE